MNVKSRTSWLSAAGLGALLLATPAVPPASAGVTIRFGRGDHRLEGQRFTTMRGLAHRLDEAAQQAALVAGDTAQERNGPMRRRFLWAINDFARQTRSFHERLDQYGNSPWDVADEVAALGQRARQVNSQIRNANAFPDTYQDWAEAVNALNLMNRLLGGQDVAIPVAQRRAYQPFDEHSRYRDGRHDEAFGESGDRGTYVTGPPLREFRRLASNLNVEMARAVSTAEQRPDTYDRSDRFDRFDRYDRSDRNDRSLADLRAFAQRASDLNRSSGADALNAREIGPVVGQLMDEARQNDRSMRESDVSPRVEWAAPIRLLEQMASIVRYQ